MASEKTRKDMMRRKPLSPINRCQRLFYFVTTCQPLNGLNKQSWGDVPTNHPNFKDIQEASVTHEGEMRNGQEFFVRLK
jgi:hypothetical protein